MKKHIKIIHVISGTRGLASTKNLLKQPGHIAAQGLHRPDALGIVLDIALFQPDAHVPIAGAGNDHLADEKEVVDRVEDMDAACPAYGHHRCANLSFEEPAVGRRNQSGAVDERLYPGRYVREINRKIKGCVSRMCVEKRFSRGYESENMSDLEANSSNLS